MRHVYQLAGRDQSEELLLGLGAGVGFVYWHQKGAPPFLGGRANVGGAGTEGLEIGAGRRTGVAVTAHTTTSSRKAEAELTADLSVGRPAMLQVDMAFLPYFDFPQEYHFGGHVIAAVGYDPDARIVLISDRDIDPHPVSLDAIAAARGSAYQPFPPKNRWWTFDFTGCRAPRPDEVRAVIGEAATAMLRAPISNLGVRGIRKAAQRIPTWPAALGSALSMACLNGHLSIDAAGGTGGGMFRYMYARFLAEASAIVGDPHLADIGKRMHAIGDQWQQVATLFNEAYDAPAPAKPLSRIQPLLYEIADAEQVAWTDLLSQVEQ